MAPEFGHGGDVEVQLLLAGEQGEAFGVGLHQAVLDAVVDHLDIVSGAAGTAMQPAFGRSEQPGERRHALHRARLAAEHDGVAVGEPPHTARYAGIDVGEAARGEFRGAAHAVLVVGVGAVDQHVAFGEQGQQLRQRVLARPARGQHQPEDARRLELVQQGGQVCDYAHAPLARQRASRSGRLVPGDHARTAARQTPRHVGAHATQPDHSDMHIGSAVDCALAID